MGSKEIGSIYEINQQSFGMKADINYDFIEGITGRKEIYTDISYLTCGREAIDLALIQLEDKIRPERKVCILPMYTCDTCIIPFEKHEWDIHYLPVNENFNYDTESLIRLYEECRPSLIMLHGYYGRDSLADIRGIVSEMQKEGLIFIEDLTQNLMCGYGKESSADYIVASLRKWFPIMDGGLLIAKHEITFKPLSEKKTFVNNKWLAMTKKFNYLQLINDNRDENADYSDIKDEFLKNSRTAEDYLYDNGMVSQMSQMSRHLLNRFDIEESQIIRKANSSKLIDLLSECKSTVEVAVNNGGSLYVPVYTDNREQLGAYLARNDVYAPILWPLPVQLECGLTKSVNRIYNKLLCLPCDFRYTEEDMEYIANVIKRYQLEKQYEQD